MASSKQFFSLAHIVIALFFGIILVSSSVVTAIRVMDADDTSNEPCRYVGQCMNSQDCVSQCNRGHNGGFCIPDPNFYQEPQQKVCCCEH
ncbi:hypothetical protein MKW94_019082 [Papaver nudicaule]|uniref:Uncharacterized protein n=1 Tax=Papaver nudicaule TaxID=74823 RepID=A0AA42APR9_PAPNU|nr:hypothetical protein [Papaver nudicaule]